MEPRAFETSPTIYQSPWRHITGDLNFQQERSREPQNTMQLVGESQSFRRYKAILQQSTGPGGFR